MTNKTVIAVERAGQDMFELQICASYKLAQDFAQKHFKSAFLQDVFVAGWNRAYWDDIATKEGSV